MLMRQLFDQGIVYLQKCFSGLHLKQIANTVDSLKQTVKIRNVCNFVTNGCKVQINSAANSS